MNKIVCISDTHNEYHNLILPEGDILIHAGDIDAYEFPYELEDFNKWLGKLPYKYKILIAGNHDGYIRRESPVAIKELLSNAIYLENSGCEINGLKFWGSPISPRFGNWFFMAERGKEINKYWNMIPDDTDVLITHGPPYGVLDLVTFPRDTHVGCFDLWDRLKRLKPKLHVFGHIHGGYGQVSSKHTTFVNASVLDEDYNLTNKPIVVEV